MALPSTPRRAPRLRSCGREPATAPRDHRRRLLAGVGQLVLHGGVQTLTRPRPALQLEIQEPHIAKYGHHAVDVVALLADLGYALHEWCDGAWCPTDRVTPRRRNYLFLSPKA
jgi:hypothetical protein